MDNIEQRLQKVENENADIRVNVYSKLASQDERLKNIEKNQAETNALLKEIASNHVHKNEVAGIIAKERAISDNKYLSKADAPMMWEECNKRHKKESLEVISTKTKILRGLWGIGSGIIGALIVVLLKSASFLTQMFTIR